MNLREFRRAGHWPTLFSAFLYFDISFMVWVLLGALANSIVDEYGLSEAEKGLMVAVPLLGGSMLRLVLGPLADHIGGRKAGLVGLTLTIVPLLLGWLWADSFGEVLLVGLLLGVAGASFAVALPLASRWYPPQYQGLAMGIAGAGNSGTALATFFGPRLAETYGWHAVFGLALIPVGLTLLFFLLFAKDSPNQPPAKNLAHYAAVLKHKDTWWFCLFYAVTFGGFVGLASFLSILFHSAPYSLSRVDAGTLATLCVISGSFLRPVGGYLSDRLGGISMLIVFFGAVGCLLLGMAATPPLLVATLVFVTIMGLLGMGNGAVFQLVPQRFPEEIGVMTGIVGAAGGLGGFFLPTMLGGVKQLTDSFSGGFLLLAGISFFALGALLYVSRSWQGVFVGKGGRAALAVDQAVTSAVEPAASPAGEPEPVGAR